LLFLHELFHFFFPNISSWYFSTKHVTYTFYYYYYYYYYYSVLCLLNWQQNKIFHRSVIIFLTSFHWLYDLFKFFFVFLFLLSFFLLVIKVKSLSLLTTFSNVLYEKKNLFFFCQIFLSCFSIVYAFSSVSLHFFFYLSVWICVFFCYCPRSKFMLLCISNIIKKKN